jgi:hypothetical protein
MWESPVIYRISTGIIVYTLIPSFKANLIKNDKRSLHAIAGSEGMNPAFPGFSVFEAQMLDL